MLRHKINLLTQKDFFVGVEMYQTKRMLVSTEW